MTYKNIVPLSTWLLEDAPNLHLLPLTDADMLLLTVAKAAVLKFDAVAPKGFPISLEPSGRCEAGWEWVLEFPFTLMGFNCIEACGGWWLETYYQSGGDEAWVEVVAHRGMPKGLPGGRTPIRYAPEEACQGLLTNLKFALGRLRSVATREHGRDSPERRLLN